MSVSGLGSNLLLNASQYYDPAGAEKANLAMQQAVKARAEFGGPHMSLYPDVFGQPQQPYTGPQAAAPSPAGGPRPPMPGQASTPAPTVPLYKAMPGTPAMGAPAAPVSLPPKPTPQPTAGQPTTPQQAAAQPAAHPAAPAWASPNFQPTDVRDAEQRFFANPQLRQQAIARRDYLIAQGIPKATAESWVNEEVGKLWGLQQQVLDHQNDQHIKFMQEQEKLLHEESATYKLEHPGAASQIGKVMEDMRTGRLTASEGRAAIAKLTHVAAPAGSGSNPSHAIALMSQENQQLKPIEQTQYSLSELQNLVDQVRNGNSAAAKQIPSFLAGLAPRVRMTNHLYSQSGAIGGIYERLANSLNQLTMGNQSPKVLNYIDKMVKQLNAQLDGARSNIVNRYKDIGKKFGYDDTLFNVSNPYDTSASTPAPAAPAPVAAPAAIPEGWSVKQTGGR